MASTGMDAPERETKDKKDNPFGISLRSNASYITQVAQHAELAERFDDMCFCVQFLVTRLVDRRQVKSTGLDLEQRNLYRCVHSIPSSHKTHMATATNTTSGYQLHLRTP